MKRIYLLMTIIPLLIWNIKAQTLADGLKSIDFERYENARNVFTSLIVQEPGKGDYYYYLGQCFMNLLQNDSAIQAYNNGIKTEPTNPSNYIGLGELLMNENKIDEAKIQFNKALSFSRNKDGKSSDARALAMVADAMVSGESKLPDEALICINEALQINKKDYNILIMAGDVMLERNDGGPAATYYEKAIDLDKNNPKAYTKVAGIWLRVRNAEATMDALNRALGIDSNYAPALKNLSEYYFQTRKFEKAKLTYLKYLKNSEESVANKTRFAQILFKLREFEEALLKIEEIQQVDKSNWYLFRLKAYCCFEVGESKKDTSKYSAGAGAMDYFFLKADPKKIIITDYEYYGKLLSRIPGRETEASFNLSKVLSIDSSRIEVYPELYMIKFKQKRFEEAASIYEIYLSKKRNPNVLDYWQIGRAYYYDGNYEKADTCYGMVIFMKPDYADAYLQKGLCKWKIDPESKTTAARNYFEKYISLAEIQPKKPSTASGLVKAYDYLYRYAIHKEDNTENAKEYINKLLVLDPENKDAKDALKQIK